MNIIEMLDFVEKVKFWTNTVTLGLMRFAVIGACVKYIFGN